MKARFLPGSRAASDGFYKRSDGSVTSMPDKEFYECD